MKICPKYTFGVGDRFANGAHAQLTAFIEAKKLGIDITPVWNKSNREHNIIGSEPSQTRQAADKAVADLGWTGEYLLDADISISPPWIASSRPAISSLSTSPTTLVKPPIQRM